MNVFNDKSDNGRVIEINIFDKQRLVEMIHNHHEGVNLIELDKFYSTVDTYYGLYYKALKEFPYSEYHDLEFEMYEGGRLKRVYTLKHAYDSTEQSELERIKDRLLSKFSSKPLDKIGTRKINNLFKIKKKSEEREFGLEELMDLISSEFLNEVIKNGRDKFIPKELTSILLSIFNNHQNGLNLPDYVSSFFSLRKVYEIDLIILIIYKTIEKGMQYEVDLVVKPMKGEIENSEQLPSLFITPDI